MNKPSDLPLSFTDPDDIGFNDFNNKEFGSVVQARVSRRGLLLGGSATAAAAMLTPFNPLASAMAPNFGRQPASGHDNAALSHSHKKWLGFEAVSKSLADQVTVPAGYSVSVLYAVGDPLNSAAAPFKNDGTDVNFENRAGDHHDGMEYFGLSNSGKPHENGTERGLLAMNHEAITQHFLHPAGALPNSRPAAQSNKEIAAHGVSVVEIRKDRTGIFSYVKDSFFNRRVTPLTPVRLSGVARGHALMKTKYSPTGTEARGTINNCGTGKTP